MRSIIVEGYDSPEIYKRYKFGDKEISKITVTDICYEGYNIETHEDGTKVMAIYSVRSIIDGIEIFFPLVSYYDFDIDKDGDFIEEMADSHTKPVNILSVIIARSGEVVTKFSGVHTTANGYKFIAKDSVGELFCINLDFNNMLVMAYCDSCFQKNMLPSVDTLNLIYAMEEEESIPKEFNYINDKDHPLTIIGIYRIAKNTFKVRFRAYSSREKNPVMFGFGPFILTRSDQRKLKRKVSNSNDPVIDFDFNTNHLPTTSDCVRGEYFINSGYEEINIFHKSFGDSYVPLAVKLAVYNGDYSFIKFNGYGVTFDKFVKDLNTEIKKVIES